MSVRTDCPNCKTSCRDVKIVNCFGCNKELCIIGNGVNKLYCVHICDKGYLEHNEVKVK